MQAEATRLKLAILLDLQQRAKSGFVPAHKLAVIHVALGEQDAALKYLQQSREQGDWALLALASPASIP